jgi:hypothetical protein
MTLSSISSQRWTNWKAFLRIALCLRRPLDRNGHSRVRHTDPLRSGLSWAIQMQPAPDRRLPEPDRACGADARSSRRRRLGEPRSHQARLLLDRQPKSDRDGAAWAVVGVWPPLGFPRRGGGLKSAGSVRKEFPTGWHHRGTLLHGSQQDMNEERRAMTSTRIPIDATDQLCSRRRLRHDRSRGEQRNLNAIPDAATFEPPCNSGRSALSQATVSSAMACICPRRLGLNGIARLGIAVRQDLGQGHWVVGNMAASGVRHGNRQSPNVY